MVISTTVVSNHRARRQRTQIFLSGVLLFCTFTSPRYCSGDFQILRRTWTATPRYAEQTLQLTVQVPTSIRACSGTGIWLLERIEQAT